MNHQRHKHLFSKYALLAATAAVILFNFPVQAGGGFGEIAYVEGDDVFRLSLVKQNNQVEERYLPMSQLQRVKQSLQGLVDENVYERNEDGTVQSKTQRLKREEEERMIAYVGRFIDFNKRFEKKFGLHPELYNLYLESKSAKNFHGVPFEDYWYMTILLTGGRDTDFLYLERMFRKIPMAERNDAFTWLNASNEYPFSCLRKRTLAENKDLKGKLLNAAFDPEINIFEGI